MNENKNDTGDSFSLPHAVAYSFGQFGDTIAYQMFTFLIFTFYYAVVGLNINLITIGFIIWSLWNAFNDPLIGTISDRTNTRWGRRTPYIVIAICPLCLIMVFLWTPPLHATEIIKFIYFIIAIMLFDTIYTTYTVNNISLFAEMFQKLEERNKVNSIRQFFTILGLLVAFIMPTIFIPKLDDPKYYTEYMYAGIFAAIIIAICAIILIKFGIKERVEFREDYKTAPPLLTSLKLSLKNKAYRAFIIPSLAVWYVIGMIPIIVPLYGSFVLGIGEGESILLGLLLGTTFISAAVFLNLWRYVGAKIGMKKAFMISMIVFIITLIPFMFISNVAMAFIVFFFLGIGLAGYLQFSDVILAAIIDSDELETGITRQGGYYGINGLILRLSTVFIFLTINFVFNSVGWAVFDPAVVDEKTIFGLRALMFIFPAIALGIGILCFSRFPITKERYEEIKHDIEKLHKEKREKFE